YVINSNFEYLAISYPLLFFFLMLPPPPRSTLFPYTTLFRSCPSPPRAIGLHRAELSRRPRSLPHGHASLQTTRGMVDRRTWPRKDRKSTRLNSSHDQISYAVFCLKKKKNTYTTHHSTSAIQM